MNKNAYNNEMPSVKERYIRVEKARKKAAK